MTTDVSIMIILGVFMYLTTVGKSSPDNRYPIPQAADTPARPANATAMRSPGTPSRLPVASQIMMDNIADDTKLM